MSNQIKAYEDTYSVSIIESRRCIKINNQREKDNVKASQHCPPSYYLRRSTRKVINKPDRTETHYYRAKSSQDIVVEDRDTYTENNETYVEDDGIYIVDGREKKESTRSRSLRPSNGYSEVLSVIPPKKKSLLEPAHFNSITKPGCKENY